MVGRGDCGAFSPFPQGGSENQQREWLFLTKGVGVLKKTDLTPRTSPTCFFVLLFNVPNTYANYSNRTKPPKSPNIPSPKSLSFKFFSVHSNFLRSRGSILCPAVWPTTKETFACATDPKAINAVSTLSVFGLKYGRKRKLPSGKPA